MDKTSTDYLVWKDAGGIHVECANCGHMISDKAPIPDKCPGCGVSVDNISIPTADVVTILNGWKN